MVSKTLKYLLPVFTKNQNSILHKMKKHTKKLVNVGLWDTKDPSEYVENSVYFLFHFRTFKKSEFDIFLKQLKQDKHYIKDYLYGDYSFDFLHMVVLKIEEEKAFKSFILSKYSEMFNEEESNLIYKPLSNAEPKVNNLRIKARKVITKNIALKKELANIFKMDSIPDDYELDNRLNPHQEFFNYKEGIQCPSYLQPLIDYYEL